jgi:hypothetical protein
VQWSRPVIPRFQRDYRKGGKFKASLGYIMKLSLSQKKKKRKLSLTCNYRTAT